VKNQTLNTTFTGSTAPLMGDVNKLVSGVNGAVSQILNRIQAIQNASRAAGMTGTAQQVSSRMESSTGIPGWAGAVAHLTQQRMMGADIGRMSARRMGLSMEAYDAATDDEKAELLARGLAATKSAQRRFMNATILGDASTWLAKAGQVQEQPAGSEANARLARSKLSTLTPEQLKETESLGMGLRRWGGLLAGHAYKAIVTGEGQQGPIEDDRQLRKLWSKIKPVPDTARNYAEQGYPAPTDREKLLFKIERHLDRINKNTE